MRRPVSLGFVIWVVIGLVVAANHEYLDDLGTLSSVLSAVLAVLAWPLVVFNVDGVARPVEATTAPAWS